MTALSRMKCVRVSSSRIERRGAQAPGSLCRAGDWRPRPRASGSARPHPRIGEVAGTMADPGHRGSAPARGISISRPTSPFPSTMCPSWSVGPVSYPPQSSSQLDMLAIGPKSNVSGWTGPGDTSTILPGLGPPGRGLADEYSSVCRREQLHFVWSPWFGRHSGLWSTMPAPSLRLESGTMEFRSRVLHGPRGHVCRALMSQSSVASETRATSAAFKQQVEAGTVSRTLPRGACHAVDDRGGSSGALGARHGQFVHGRRVGPSTAGDCRHCRRLPVHWRPPIPLTTLR